jgi:hypothetical protein
MGTVRLICGRLDANASTQRLVSKSATGAWRRHREVLGNTERRSATLE